MNPYFKEKPNLLEEIKIMERFRKRAISELESAKQQKLKGTE